MLRSRLDSERMVMLGLGAVVLIVGMLTVTPWPVGAFQDDAIYTVLAKSLATGEGFRMINLPGSPNATHYPPGYPLVLAALWKLWPSFPDNIVLFKFANTGFLALAAVGTYAFARERWQLSAPQAIVTALVGTISIVVLLLTGVVLSEPLFMALLMPALLYSERAVSTGHVRPALIAGLLLGVLAMVRTLGAFAVPVACLLLLLRGHWRAMLALGAAAALFLVPWQLWVSAHQGEIAAPLVGKYGSYGDWLVEGYASGGWAFARDVLVRNARDVDTTLGFMLMPVLARWPRVVVGIAALVFAAAGMKRYGRATPVTLSFLGSYMLVIMLWPFEPNRFIIAIWPLLLPLLGFGVAACWRLPLATPVALPWRGAVVAAALAMSSGYLWYNGTGYHRKWWAAVQRNAGQRARPTAEWVARYTSPNDVLATEDDLIVYLYTGRRAVPTSTFRAGERIHPLTDQEDLATVEEIFQAYDPTFYIVGGDQGIRTSQALAQRNPPVLRLLGRTNHVLIFQRLTQ
ncbi:MAG: hypothetical protein ABIZ91_11225 [Gemmatimonadaceae bacterium]